MYVGVQVYSQTVQDAYVVVYSVTDRSSFVYAQSCLVDIKRRRKTLARTTTTTMSSAVVTWVDIKRRRKTLARTTITTMSSAVVTAVDIKRRRKTLARSTTTTMSSAVVLVANKQDQVRSRVVSESGPHRDLELINITRSHGSVRVL